MYNSTRTILITGATRGLGRRLAELIAIDGYHLLLHGRDGHRLAEVAEELRSDHPDVTVDEYSADLADLAEVEALATAVTRDHPRLDVVVNNAACGGGADPHRRQTSRQGHELRFAVNHLAPLLLTWRLSEPLVKTRGRVVNVASIGQAPVDFGDLMFTRDYHGVEAYCRSKLALISAGFTLAGRWGDDGVTVNSVHPAHLMDTTMVADSGFTPEATVDYGAVPVKRLIDDPALAGVTGRYFDRLDDARAHQQAYDPASREQLWKLSWQLIDG